MGVKAIKDKYQIKHIVQLRVAEVSWQKSELCLCIGSPYIPEAIVVSMAGKIVKGGPPDRSNNDLNRIYRELEADQGEVLAGLIKAQDNFEGINLVRVYTFENGLVLKKFAEEGKIGYPHTFTDGEIMYENTTFTDIHSARAACLIDAKAGVKSAIRTNKEAWSEVLARIKKVTGYLFREIFYYIRSQFQ